MLIIEFNVAKIDSALTGLSDFDLLSVNSTTLYG
jgi:hypothetical protein